MDKKKILLIGAGFIGTNFYKLFRDKYEITIVDDFSYPCTLANGLWDMDIFESRVIRQDFCHPEAMKTLIAEVQPDYVVNMAARSHVDRSIHEHFSFLLTNTFGVEQLLKTVVDKPIRVVHFSTDEVYGDTDFDSKYEFSEEDSLEPSSPYSASKAAADMVVNAYVRTYGVNVVTVRPTNNYGPYQYPEKFIPFLIKRFAEGKTLPIYGAGKNIREWLHVEDCCRAVELVMREGTTGGVYNIGSRERHDNDFVAGFISDNREYVTDRPGHDRRYAVNSDKVRSLGWLPQIDFNEGLERTKEWYLERLPIIRNLEANKHIK